MRMVPFGLQDISRLAIATAAPLSPLLLTIFSFEELMIRLFKVSVLADGMNKGLLACFAVAFF